MVDMFVFVHLLCFKLFFKQWFEEFCFECAMMLNYAKVNVLTGKKGWHKRINQHTTQVKRTAEFSDGICLDDGSGLDKMEEVMKKSTMKSIKTSHAAPSPCLAAAGACSFVTWSLL